MNYIDHLKSLSPQQMKIELKQKLLESQSIIIEDPSRLRLLSEDFPNLNAWSEIDEIELDEPVFDEKEGEVVVTFGWQSIASGDENDERVMHGGAKANINADGTVSLTETSAELEGPSPEPPMDSDE
jgi:hypothetical protein